MNLFGTSETSEIIFGPCLLITSFHRLPYFHLKLVRNAKQFDIVTLALPLNMAAVKIFDG